MADPYPIRPITEAEFGAFSNVDEHAFNGGPLEAADLALVLGRFEFDRSLAAFDSDVPVGIASAYSFRLTVPGGIVPAAGVTWVSVLPTHRRRGTLRSIMRRQLSDLAEGNEPVAALWASEAMLYGRYGYGKASWNASFTIGRGEGTLSGEAPRDESVRLRLVPPEDARPELAKVFDTVAQTRPGFFARNDAWWDSRLHDLEARREGHGPLRCLLAESHPSGGQDGGPRGYALYSGLGRWEKSTFLADGAIDVRELIGVDPAAEAALWENLFSRDLVTQVRAQLRPADDPLLFQLTDPRRLRPVICDGLWIRIVDLPAALTARRYAAPVSVVLEVRDALLPANAGRWRLTAPGAGPGSGPGARPGTPFPSSPDPVCERTSAIPDISLDISELAAAYLGGTQLGSLAAAGLVTEHQPGSVARLSAAMTWSPSPWCPLIF
jgi:predicted acetyltransferase